MWIRLNLQRMKFADLYERAEVALVEAKKLGKSQTMISKGLPLEP